MMSKSLFILITFALVFGVIGQGIPSPTRSYHFREVLTNQTGRFFEIYWRFIGDRIFLAIVCNTNPGGYCGIGWSISGAMLGSDAILGSVSPNPVIEDYILNQKVPPQNGTCPNAACPESLPIFTNCSNNVRNVTGSSINGYLVLEFSRPINASDPCDRPVQDGAIIWAAGDGAVPNGVTQHAFRAFITSFDGFVWFRPIPTTGVPTTAVPTTGSASTGVVTTGVATTGVTTTGVATTALPSVDTNDSPTSQVTSISAGTSETLNIVSADSSSKFVGLPLWLAILILVIVICAVCILVSVALGCFMRHKKKSHEQHGNFY